jgi:hypothetical protein
MRIAKLDLLVGCGAAFSLGAAVQALRGRYCRLRSTGMAGPHGVAPWSPSSSPTSGRDVPGPAVEALPHRVRGGAALPRDRPRVHALSVPPEPLVAGWAPDRVNDGVDSGFFAEPKLNVWRLSRRRQRSPGCSRLSRMTVGSVATSEWGVSPRRPTSRARPRTSPHRR